MTQSREATEANSFAEAFEASLNFKTPGQGELLRGQIVSISGDDAFVSYGGPSEAVMAAAAEHLRNEATRPERRLRGRGEMMQHTAVLLEDLLELRRPGLS